MADHGDPPTFRQRAVPKAPLILGAGVVMFVGALAVEAQVPPLAPPLGIAGFVAAVFGLTLWKDYVAQRSPERGASGGVSKMYHRTLDSMQQAQEAKQEQERAAREKERKFYENAAGQYGTLVMSKMFGNRQIELFDKGYIRVGGVQNRDGGPPTDLSRLYVVAYSTPFEKLRAIKATTQIQDKSAGGRAIASAASGGLSRMASNEKRLVFLTITTDQQVYTLKDKGGMTRYEDEAAMALEAAGLAMLESGAAPAVPSPTPAIASGAVSDQLNDLVALHRDGALTDEEFASAKAKLLRAD